MAGMRMRTKICAGLAVILFACFLWGISDSGQRYLIGTPSPDHWVRDDQFMGAGAAPFIYCLLPSLVLVVIAVIFFVFERKKSK